MVQVLSRINFTKINHNYEYFQIILEQFVDGFNQKWTPKGKIFADRAKSSQRLGASPPEPHLLPAAGGSQTPAYDT